jgi:hypothetical protein
LYRKPPPPPPSWVSGYNFDCLAPSTMHLLCLNSAKNTLDKLGELLAIFNLNEGFARYARNVTKSMMCLNLDWLSMLEWKKRGGYVSENWLALTHVEKYFCAGAVLQMKDYEYVQPSKPVNRWTVKEKKKWLSVRGIKVDSKALKPAVDLLFFADFNRVGGPTPLLLEPGFHTRISKLMCSYCGLVASVMNDTIVQGESSKECEWYAKQYLTMMHDFQESIEKYSAAKRGPNYLPLFVSTWSYINLLGFPAAIDKWGSMRKLWEGGNIGEGLLRSVKPLVPRFSNNKSALLLKRWYEGRALGRAKTRGAKPNTFEPSEHDRWMKLCAPCFSLDSVRKRFIAHEALVVVRFHKFPLDTDDDSAAPEQRFTILIKDRPGNPSYSAEFPYVAVGIRCTQFAGTVASCPFFDWSIDRFDTSSINTSIWKFTHSCLLLPATEEFGLPTNNPTGKPYYTVTSEFEEMAPTGSFLRFRWYQDT